MLALAAVFEADLAGLALARGSRSPRRRAGSAARSPSSAQEKHLVALDQAGGHTVGELEELFSVIRSTVYRAVRRSALASTTEPTLSSRA